MVVETFHWFKDLLKKNDQRRSLSTGDLAVSRPSCSNPDLMEISFDQHPTTSSLPDHFDDCDRVPMNFSEGKPKLMSQSHTMARKMMQSGERSSSVGSATITELHLSQKWFFPGADIRKAERILMTNGMIQGSFVVLHFNGQFVLSVWHKQSAQHLKINQFWKNGEPTFRLDIDKSFKNVCELVDYYRRHKGFVLPTKLSVGVGRGPHALRSRA
ncbi:unnamed protein product [Caenorhabditis auriculariae]|uniref:SH2 domain-containing protein n=1 Tax=Caenorhabditis auriculariae TaxID=2777116 RepID=A0A8S1HNG0_9PELO|nr:unnamed protein product [Caenorhabditis auriculariae]